MVSSVGNKQFSIVLKQEHRYHPRELRLLPESEIRGKLDREFARAQAHLRAQALSFPPEIEGCSFPIASHSERLAKAAIRVGVAVAQGLRPTMEDCHIVSEGTIQSEEGKPIDYQLFGVIDGHGGKECAEFVAAHLQQEIESAIQKHGTSDAMFNALKEAFVQLDARIVEANVPAGAVANICVKIGSRLWVANLGDSRAILKVGDEIIQLSVDAKPDDPRFRHGIEKRGGEVKWPWGVPRIDGTLACARAFGDKKLAKTHYHVSPRPKIVDIDLSQYSGKPIYLIQCCDGVWDVLTSQQLADLVVPGKSMEQVAIDIESAALNSGSQDNCSTLVTVF